MKIAKYHNTILTALAVLIFLALGGPSLAQKHQYESTHLSKQELAEILKRGDVLSLEKIIKHLSREKDDRMLEVELLNYDGVHIYQIEILKASGIVVTYYLDGKTGQDASHLLED